MKTWLGCLLVLSTFSAWGHTQKKVTTFELTVGLAKMDNLLTGNDWRCKTKGQEDALYSFKGDGTLVASWPGVIGYEHQLQKDGTYALEDGKNKFVLTLLEKSEQGMKFRYDDEKVITTCARLEKKFYRN